MLFVLLLLLLLLVLVLVLLTLCACVRACVRVCMCVFYPVVYLSFGSQHRHVNVYMRCMQAHIMDGQCFAMFREEYLQVQNASTTISV